MADANQGREPLDSQGDSPDEDARRSQSVPTKLVPPTVRIRDHSEAQEDDSPPLLDKSKKKASWLHSKVNWNQWHCEFEKNGRVLVIDYVRHESVSGKVRAVAYEFHDVETIRQFYADGERCKRAALRFVHVQNAPWATRFLMRKYNIDNRDHIVGIGFARWAKYDRPECRAGKPLLKAKAWRTDRDPYRGVSRCALSFDYLKSYEAQEGPSRTAEDVVMHDSKMMELNTYDERDEAKLGWDVHVQRFNCYIQYADGEPLDTEKYPNNPYHQNDNKQANGDARPGNRKKQNYPSIDSLDNGHAIIVFEQSNTNSCQDTLIQARNQLENRWRKLSLYLSNEQIVDDDAAALNCMNLILSDIFKGLAFSWEQFLSLGETHVSILEDKIYADPADESRAEEIWLNGKNALRVEKLIYLHISVVKAITVQVHNLASDEDEPNEWLEGTNAEFERLSELVQESLVKPVTSLNDLMYKSVGIRDARRSLQLGTSMWRLSWITFIFLPLTFIVGFFGMNVDTFESMPSIKWYFVAAVPMMVLVLILHYVLKHYATQFQQTPYQRGIYEHLFHDLATTHPNLWTRNGPRKDVRPLTFVGRLKWRLLNIWFDPARTINFQAHDPDDDGSSDLGRWAATKRYFARSWLVGLTVTHEEQSPDESDIGGYTSDTGASTMSPGPESGNGEGAAGGGVVAELALLSQPILSSEGAPIDSASQLAETNRIRLSPLLRGRLSDGRRRSSTGSRPGSSGTGRPSSGAMVEERDLSDDEPLQQQNVKASFLNERAALSGVGAWGRPSPS